MKLEVYGFSGTQLPAEGLLTQLSDLRRGLVLIVSAERMRRKPHPDFCERLIEFTFLRD